SRLGLAARQLRLHSAVLLTRRWHDADCAVEEIMIRVQTLRNDGGIHPYSQDHEERPGLALAPLRRIAINNRRPIHVSSVHGELLQATRACVNTLCTPTAMYRVCSSIALDRAARAGRDSLVGSRMQTSGAACDQVVRDGMEVLTHEAPGAGRILGN